MSYQHFNKDDRNELSILLQKGYSYRNIGIAINKSPSAISREIKQNSVNGIYNPIKANQKAKKNRLYSKFIGMKVRNCNELEQYVINGLKYKRWTPEEIAGRWNSENHLDQQGNKITISAISIYKYLYSVYGEPLCQYLLSKRQKRKKRNPDKQQQKRELIPDKISINERPVEVSSRAVFAHFEGDTLGKIKIDNEVVAGLLERQSRYLLIMKVPKLKYALDGFNKLLIPYHNIVQSLTLDNGVENIKYQMLKVKTYFCDSYSPWQKGSIENAFKRLRRFIPKKASLKNYSDTDILSFATLMNNTPRKCLNWKTPKEVFDEQILLHSKLLLNPNKI